MSLTYPQCHEAAMQASIQYGGPMGDWSTLTADEQTWTQYGVDQVRANPTVDFETTFVNVLNYGAGQGWNDATLCPTIYGQVYGTMRKEVVFDALAQAALQ